MRLNRARVKASQPRCAFTQCCFALKKKQALHDPVVPPQQTLARFLSKIFPLAASCRLVKEYIRVMVLKIVERIDHDACGAVSHDAARRPLVLRTARGHTRRLDQDFRNAVVGLHGGAKRPRDVARMGDTPKKSVVKLRDAGLLGYRGGCWSHFAADRTLSIAVDAGRAGEPTRGYLICALYADGVGCWGTPQAHRHNTVTVSRTP